MTDTSQEPLEAGETTTPGKHSRRLSPLRVFGALVLIAFASFVGKAAFDRASAEVTALPDLWFAPYVDVTLTPRFDFEDPQQNPSSEVVLSFIVADPSDPCTPSWGGAYTLDQASNDLDLERRIERVRRWGGNVIVSLGGERNDELADVCHDVEDLTAAYATIVERYGLSTIDLDIEGPALADSEAADRRSKAIKAVQDARRTDGASLAIWLTLPVSSHGLTPEGVGSIDSMLNAGVDLTGVNLMVMNFGQSRGADDMSTTVAQALDAAHIQLRNAYRRADMDLKTDQIWRKIGATPMIGQNDISTDSFDLDAARELLSILEERPLGRISFWSLNRDKPCGPNVDPRSVSNHCSGVIQAPMAFSQIFSGIEGLSSVAAETITVAVAPQDIVDDPATSPYPIWQKTKAYAKGAKIVWRANVYQAKWWSLADTPDAPVVSEWDTPWRLLGPVLPGDRPAPTTTLPSGLRPGWNGTSTYLEGAQVQWRGTVYEAKWWNSGEQPGIDVPSEWNTPWRPLDGSQVLGEG